MKKELLALCTSISFFLLAPSANATSEAEQVMNLLSAFQADCSLVDANASQAITAVSNLITVLENAKKSEACQSLAGVGADLMADKLKAQSFWSPGLFEDYQNDAEKELAKLEIEKKDLLLQLVLVTSSKDVENLQAQVRSVELKINQKRIDVQATEYNEKKERQFRAIQILVDSMNRNFDQIAANQACWVDKPSVLQSATATASSIAFSASIATPIALPAMAVGAGLQLLSKAIETINKIKFDKKINAFVEVITPVALTCTLERFNDIYCESHDRERLLSYVRANTSQISKSSIWLGMRVLNQDLDQGMMWLEKIRNSGSPNDSQAAQTLKEFKIREAKLVSSEDVFNGLKAEKDKLLNSSGLTHEEVFLELKNFVSKLLMNLECYEMDGDYVNPFCAYYSSNSQFAFSLFGYSESAYATYKAKNPNDFKFDGFLYQQYLDTNQFNGEKPDLTTTALNSAFQSLFQKVKRKFEREKQAKISEDTEGVFFKAYAAGSSPTAKNSAPYESLKNMQKFLKTTISPNDPVPAYFQKVDLALAIILQTIDLVNSGAITAEDGKLILFEEKTLPDANNPCLVNGALSPLCATPLIQLREGSSFFRARLYSVIDYRLKSTLLEKNLIKDDVKLQLLLSNDFISELQKLQGSNDDDMITALSSAKAAALHTSNKFTSTFKSEFQDSLNFYLRKKAQYNETEFGTHYRLLARMCYYLLINDPENKEIFSASCKGVFWKPLFEKGIVTPAMGDSLYNLSLPERVCLFRNVSRQNKLLQKQNVTRTSQPTENENLQNLLRNYPL